MYAETSAKTGDGINELFEQIVNADTAPTLYSPVIKPGLTEPPQEENQLKPNDNKKSNCC